METVSNKDLYDEIIKLRESLDENTSMNKHLIELLERNNTDTKFIREATEVGLTPEQQWKDFAMNVAANIAGNGIKTPTFLNLTK